MRKVLLLSLSRWPRHWRFLFYGAAGTLAVIPAFLLLFAWSGIYNVAASTGHWWITYLILDIAKSRSIRLHSLGIDPPPLDDDNLIRLGAGIFNTTCAGCHGSPGETVKPIPQSMLPAPPPLSVIAREWKPAELYWIVRHGLKYTGMPAWAAERRDDEVWSVIAFLQVLPQLSKEEYRALVSRTLPSDIEKSIASVPKLGSCLTCHDGAGLAATSDLVPKLAGQSKSYIAQSLHAYAKGARFSGIMEPVAAGLTVGDIDLLATYYGSLVRTEAKMAEHYDQALINKGRNIFNLGIVAQAVPACTSCHGRAPVFPALEGQSSRYTTTQLQLFRSGSRGNNASSDLMRAIALRLDARAIDAIAAYVATLPVGRAVTSNMTPAPVID
jgi:cytochrome c553